MKISVKNSAKKNRQLRIESLEERQLLSVTASDFTAIKSQYEDLNLGNFADYNIIEITANELSDAKLRSAIAEAGNTAANDLIVLRTTATQSKITLSSAPLGISIDAATKGSVTIVSIGNAALTIDANQQSRVFYIYNSEVGLAGLTITNGKAAGYGGGINIYSSNVTIARSTISNNSAEMAGGSQGGGLSARDSNVVLNQVDFIENLSTANTNGYGDGGGLYLEDSAAKVTNSTFKGNSAWGAWGAQGGGCYTWDTDATFTNCVFVGNDASDDGSGASDYLSTGGGMSQAGGTVTLTNVTIAGNRATTYGAGYYVDGRNGATAATTYIRNSIVALNTGVAEQYHTSQGGKTYENNNLKTDPKFVQNPGSIDSKNYGNLQLQSSSPAVNKGNNTYVAGVLTDILGNARIANGTVDRGAYEYQSTPAKPTAPGNLTAKVLPVSNGKLPVQINWNAAEGATHYILHRWEEGDYKADGKTKNWKIIYAMKPAEQIPSGGTLSTFQVINSDVSKVTAKQVQYLVRGYNGDVPGESVNIFVTLNSTPVVKPTAPGNLTAKVLLVSNGKLPIQINWNTAEEATHYILHRWEEGDYKADGKTKNWKVIYAMKPAGQIPSGGLLSDFQVINSDVSKVTAKQVQYLVRGYNGDVPGESASVFVTVN